MSRRPPIINVMAKAAFRAARPLVRDFGEVEQLQVSHKGPSDFVSTADLKVETSLFEQLSHSHPEIGFLMEEQGVRGKPDAPRRWIIDPLDGTLNFLHGLPHFAISIALEEQGELIAAIILDPIRDELFWAARGEGAFVNHRRIRVSSRVKMAEALLATGIPWASRKDHAAFSEELLAIMPKVAGIRRWGVASLDLAYVAAGRYDGFWETQLKPWDIAAGILIVREAGGLVSELDGGQGMVKSGSILASNEKLYDQLSEIFGKAKN
ncbi:MAG: inositol monophosphatase [Proteobacteria bacterium]|nr:inositol monophosphatase [Pseudomonadota bacterium]